MCYNSYFKKRAIKGVNVDASAWGLTGDSGHEKEIKVLFMFPRIVILHILPSSKFILSDYEIK